MLGERPRSAQLYSLTLDAIATGTVVTYEARHVLDTVAGIAAACGRHWDAAASHDEKALRLAGEMPCVSEQAEARYWYARMLVDRDAAGDGERARSMRPVRRVR